MEEEENQTNVYNKYIITLLYSPIELRTTTNDWTRGKRILIFSNFGKIDYCNTEGFG